MSSLKTKRKRVRSISKLELRFSSVLIPLGFESNIPIGEFKPDWTNQKSKIIFEIYGDYWHMNPKKYGACNTNPTTGRSAHIQWEMDENRVKALEDLGYRVYVLWAAEIGRKRSKRSLQELILKKILTLPVI